MLIFMHTDSQFYIYRKFQIKMVKNHHHGTMFYLIYKDYKQYSQMCMYSIQACKNVIDTHINNTKQQPLLWN